MRHAPRTETLDDARVEVVRERHPRRRPSEDEREVRLHVERVGDELLRRVEEPEQRAEH